MESVQELSGSDEFDNTGVWGAGGGGSELVLALKQLVDSFSVESRAATLPPPQTPSTHPSASVHKDTMFCSVSPFGSHIDEAVR